MAGQLSTSPENATVPASISGQPDHDASGAGSTAQHPQPGDTSPVASVAVETLATMTATHTTTRRMRVNVSHNSKGYSHDTTFEITSDDPDIYLRREMELGLHDAYWAAHDEIGNRELTDGKPDESSS